MDKKIIKLTEQDIHKIVEDVASQFIDKGVYTPIGNSAYGKTNINNKPYQADNYSALKESLNSIASKLYTEVQFLKTTLNVQNPIFIKNIKDNRERKIADIAQKTYARCMDLYVFLHSMEDELER
jgi:prephenate dehydratase